MIPSHKKIAWAFLDKLLGRTEPEPAPQTLTNKQRNALLESSVTHMGSVLGRALGVGAKAFAKQIHKESASVGLDSRIVFRRLVQPRKHWPRLPKGLFQWLDTITSVLIMMGEVPMLGKAEVPPELEPSIDHVLTNLAKWAQQQMKPFLEKAYLETLQKEARNLLPVYTYPDTELPTLPKVTLALMHEFEWRLDHARLPVPYADLMFRVLRLFT